VIVTELEKILGDIRHDLSFDWRYFAQLRLAELGRQRKSDTVETLVLAYLVDDFESMHWVRLIAARRWKSANES
jgi:hypothetical protein